MRTLLSALFIFCILAAQVVAGDLFPDKLSITHAVGFSVEYHKEYKVVTVRNPWPGANQSFTYVLVQRGSQAPDIGKATVIEIPIKSLVTMSTTYLSQLEAINQLDKLVGVENFKLISNPTVKRMIRDGKLVEVGRDISMNVERVLELNPDIILSYTFNSAQADTHRVVTNAGAKVVLNGSYLEGTPLARSEWLKFISLFFNEEKQAEKIFSEMEKKYLELVKLTKNVEQRPTVFTNAPFKDIWHISGGGSYTATALADAGANFLWAEDNHRGTIPLDFETVFNKAAHADLWLNPYGWKSLEEGLTQDKRFALFDAFKNGEVYNQ